MDGDMAHFSSPPCRRQQLVQGHNFIDQTQLQSSVVLDGLKDGGHTGQHETFDCHNDASIALPRTCDVSIISTAFLSPTSLGNLCEGA